MLNHHTTRTYVLFCLPFLDNWYRRRCLQTILPNRFKKTSSLFNCRGDALTNYMYRKWPGLIDVSRILYVNKPCSSLHELVFTS